MSDDLLYDSLKTVCARRRSIRRFDGRPLTSEQIQRIRDIAAFTPYASGRKNWDLLVITDRQVISRLARLVKEKSMAVKDRLTGDFGEGFLRYAENFSAFESAPALFIPIFRVQPLLSGLLPEADEEVRRWERDSFVKSISCVAMLVLLAASSLGLGSCYMTGPLVAERELADCLGLRPGREIAALIPVGYPSDKSAAAPKSESHA